MPWAASPHACAHSSRIFPLNEAKRIIQGQSELLTPLCDASQPQTNIIVERVILESQGNVKSF